MAEIGGLDSYVPAWVQAVGALIGTSLVAGAALWGKLRDPSPAISQTRLEATETMANESRANREVLRAVLEATQTLVACVNAMREMMARIVISQEEIVRLMREQHEDNRFAERTERLLSKVRERDRRAEED